MNPSMLPGGLLAASLLAASSLVAVSIAGPAPAGATEITAAQPELPKERLVIVTHDGVQHDFMVEDATTPLQQETGLMFRKTVPVDSGMLFDWGTARESDMWMKNTIAPLDMLFIGKDGIVTHIAENTVPQSLAVISSGGAVRATLELAAGVAERLDIRVGDKVLAKEFGNLK